MTVIPLPRRTVDQHPTWTPITATRCAWCPFRTGQPCPLVQGPDIPDRHELAEAV